MAGGNWTATDMPVLPGLYMNFKAAALAAIASGARGVVAIPVKAHWGPIAEFVEITSVQQIIDYFTEDITNNATAYTSLYFALLGGASKVLAYRLASTAAALATTTLVDTTASPINVLRLDAKYKGTRGNSFKATVQVNSADATKKDIKLYEGTTLLRTFTFTSGTVDAAVSAINNDTGNVWVTATKLAAGNGTLANVSAQAFASGDSGISGVVSADYTAFLTALETQTFNLLALDGVTDSAIHTLVAAWIARVRGEGMGVMGVMGGTTAADTAADAVSQAVTRSAGFNFEGIVNIGTGAKLDGIEYSSAQVASYVAGLIGGQKLSESTTYAPTPFDDVTRRWTRSEMEAAIAGGVFILYHDGSIVKPLRGINTLTTLGQDQGSGWKKIRTIRVMDAINSDLQVAAEANYIGKVNNTAEGRASLIGAFKEYMQTLAMDGIIENTGWDVFLDPDYYGATAKKNPEADQVFVKWEAYITDVMEQIFGTFVVY
ncbi:MAG: phage tail sheath protein [Syntrophomonadaceae bacterium]|nr:phage tail sheath protein [Syntrophomonadaceae bacterium]